MGVSCVEVGMGQLAVLAVYGGDSILTGRTTACNCI